MPARKKKKAETREAGCLTRLMIRAAAAPMPSTPLLAPTRLYGVPEPACNAKEKNKMSTIQPQNRPHLDSGKLTDALASHARGRTMK